MSPLREALLVAGAVFLGLLTAWEVLKARRAAQRRGAPPAPAEAPRAASPPAPRAAPPPAAKPALTNPATLDTVPGLLGDPGTDAGPQVEWPPEGRRVIVALRLVSVLPERFSGAALRQALLAEGFVLGRYGIFHKAQATGRAYLSAASLTQPGSFDSESMDGQRFGGLSLFAVLPGPKPPLDTFDDLLTAARGLNDRLQGALQDERGLPLTPLRVAGLRQALTTELPA
jgi:FtsZ-interacting cell division protein ZipA